MTSQDKTRLQREIEATDRQIDQLVYELYGLTEADIKFVETDNGSKWKPLSLRLLATEVRSALTGPCTGKRIAGIVGRFTSVIN